MRVDHRISQDPSLQVPARKRQMNDGCRLSFIIATLSLLVTLAACATGPEPAQTFHFDDELAQTGQFEQWFDGVTPAVDVDDPSAEALFLAGEALYWEGDLEEAYDYYVAMVAGHRGHALNRYAAFRLYRMRNSVIDFEERIAADLEGVNFDDEGALTRLELARIAHQVEYRRWQRSQDSVPFRSYAAPMVHRWRVTPNLSPWRLSDFDRPMAPEEEERLAEGYLSPRFSLPAAVHEEPTRVVAVDRPRQRLGLGDSGVYYLESWLTVEPGAVQDLTMYGQFPGAVRIWIDGQEVMERREEGYESGRLMRSMTLEPGTYRVLVKMAYRSGSRNWFELFWVPRTGSIFGDARMAADIDGQSFGNALVLHNEQRRAIDYEPVTVGVDGLDRVSTATLYAAALSAYASGENERFGASWQALMERYPEFAAGHMLGSYQIRTRWDVPSELRDARSISMMRQAERYEPDNLHVLVQLERLLREQGEDREVRRLLERARRLALRDGAEDGRGSGEAVVGEGDGVAQQERGSRQGEEFNPQVRQLQPLVSWARYLEDQGWSEEAEQAWREVLGIDADNCSAIRRLQSLYRTRNYFPPMEEISKGWTTCSSAVDRWLRDHPDRLEEQLEFAERRARRLPYDTTRQQRWANALRALGRVDEARAVLDESLERMPQSSQLWDARIDLALGEDEGEGLRILEKAIEISGRTGSWEWKRARLSGQFPLQQLLRDGRQAALEEVRRTGLRDDVEEEEQLQELAEEDQAMVLDDAYYVIDFAARHYLDDGSSWILTHQVVRTMTRGAIDRYAELTIPRNIYLLEARTIKEDGQVLVPEGVSGDSTLSMPGLAPGDMVEVAYLQFRPAGSVPRHSLGNHFYFRMPGVSSRHSEYVVIGTEGFEFEGANDPPALEEFEFQGQQAARFVATDTRRPRSEPRRVDSPEYLPWIREVRVGIGGDVLDMERRYMKETLRHSTRRSPEVDEAAATWLGREFPGGQATDEDVRNLFYGATEWFRSLSPGRFSVEAAHAVQRRQGSPLVVMSVALRELGVDHDVYLARSDEAPPKELKAGEISNFRHSLMRVVLPESGKIKWLQLDRSDAMFGAVEPELVGQSAICVTCEEFRREDVAIDDERRPRRHVEMEAVLDEQGALSGQLHYEFRGRRAVRVRSALRGRTDAEDRRSYFAEILTGQISGADLLGYTIEGEDTPDAPLRFSIDFERRDFARQTGDQLVIDRALFDERMQNIYAQLPSRLTPMFVGYEREQSYDVRIELPDHESVRLGATDVSADEGRSAFGRFHRRTRIDDGVLHLESAIDLSRQRIQPDDYPAFRQWATTVQESGDLWLELR